MSLFVLLFAHLVADYPLQGDFLASQKGKRAILMATHCAIWAGCVCTAGYLCGFNVVWADAVFLFVVHYIIDSFKARNFYATYLGLEDPLGAPLWIDQALHVVQLLLFWSFAG